MVYTKVSEHIASDDHETWFRTGVIHEYSQVDAVNDSPI